MAWLDCSAWRQPAVVAGGVGRRGVVQQRHHLIAETAAADASPARRSTEDLTVREPARLEQ
jgi:hypothetical protein